LLPKKHLAKIYFYYTKIFLKVFCDFIKIHILFLYTFFPFSPGRKDLDRGIWYYARRYFSHFDFSLCDTAVCYPHRFAAFAVKIEREKMR